MINIPISIKLPKLWGAQTFTKSEWADINLLVGSNGTGKSLFADQLKTNLVNNGFKPRVLNAERLSGLEKQDYNYFSGGSNFSSGINISHFGHLKVNGDTYGLSSSAFVTLKERLDVRIKIGSLIIRHFWQNYSICGRGRLYETKMQNNEASEEYGLKENQCHGLKELITILTFLYDDAKDCLNLDEPEMHLHPQFQSFLLNEIRNIAGDPNIDPSKKLFFIITHSPYFIDLRSIDDLKNILIAHKNEPPTYVENLSPQEEYVLKRFLPRFNTHHKQFFFSPNPVFV